MRYPTISEYISSIKFAEDNLDNLMNLRPVLDTDGEPIITSGGFAVVFKMKDVDTGKLYAVKCFTREVENLSLIYREISHELGNSDSPYLTKFKYYEKELFVDGTEYPVLLMDWVEGKNMDAYIAENYKNKDLMKSLYTGFCELAVWLRSQKFAHGDLKPDNIMISKGGTLTLVDYDSMFVPSLSGRVSLTTGTKAFSHPMRTPYDFDETIDDFTLASMSISLYAISEDSILYDKYCRPDRLLFSDDDYRDLDKSEAYKYLKKSGHVYSKLLRLFKDCLTSNDKNKNKNIYDQIMDLQTKVPVVRSFDCSNGTLVYKNDVLEFCWSVDNVSQITVEGIDVTNKPNYSDSAVSSKDFVLVAKNGYGSVEKEVKVDVLIPPVISFKPNSKKLRKGKDESVTLMWNVQNCNRVMLRIGDDEINVEKKGKKEILLGQTTKCQLNVVGLDGKRIFTKSEKIGVFSDSETEFFSDKSYTLPSVPIKLSWRVQHAKEVELEGMGKVDFVGSQIFEPREDSTYKLIVIDAFGRKEHTIDVRMLPIPCVKSLQIPTPEFTNTMNVNLKLPQVELSSMFPKVELLGVELKTPFVPSLTDAELNVKLTNTMSSQSNLLDEVKSLFNYYRRKILDHEK